MVAGSRPLTARWIMCDGAGCQDPNGFSILNWHGGQYRLALEPAKVPPQRPQRCTEQTATVAGCSSINCAQSTWPERTSAPDGQSSTHRPQSVHRDHAEVSVKVSGSLSDCLSRNASVGHALTHTPHAEHAVAARRAERKHLAQGPGQ